MILSAGPSPARGALLLLAAAAGLHLGACTTRPYVAATPGVSPQHQWSPPLAYPQEMRESGREGSVVLEGTVDTTGRVVPGSVRVVRSSHHAFEAPAIAMLYGSRFRPAEAGGHAVDALVRIPVRFEIQRSGAVTPEDSLAAVETLEEARRLMREGRMTEAMTAFTRARELDSRLAEAGEYLQPLCWYGSLWGYAEEVVGSCDRLVSLAPDRVDWRDARGVARALTGDLTGAIADFQAVAERTLSAVQRSERLEWIADLRAGRNPLTPEVLRVLRERRH